MQGRSNLIAFLLVGLVIGSLAGYMTRPERPPSSDWGL